MTSPDLAGRDLQIVQLIARFKQASIAQARELLFPGVASRTPADTAFKRLTNRSYLRRIERRTVGGNRGGSGQYVYELGRRGFFMFYDGRFNPRRSVDYHALAILDTFIALRRLEAAGKFRLLGYSTEPDCWVKVGGDMLMPDMYAEFDRGSGNRLPLWFEIDLGTEGQRHIKEKLDRYWRAFTAATTDQFPHFPNVLWVAVDDERAKELRWIIGQMPEAAQALQRVRTLATLPSVFGG